MADLIKEKDQGYYRLSDDGMLIIKDIPHLHKGMFIAHRDQIKSVIVLSATSIEEGTFAGFTGLKDVEIAAPGVHLHARSFEGCLQLKNVHFLEIPEMIHPQAFEHTVFDGELNLDADRYLIPQDAVTAIDDDFINEIYTQITDLHKLDDYTVEEVYLNLQEMLYQKARTGEAHALSLFGIFVLLGQQVHTYASMKSQLFNRDHQWSLKDITSSIRQYRYSYYLQEAAKKGDVRALCYLYGLSRLQLIEGIDEEELLTQLCTLTPLKSLMPEALMSLHDYSEELYEESCALAILQDDLEETTATGEMHRAGIMVLILAALFGDGESADLMKDHLYYSVKDEKELITVVSMIPRVISVILEIKDIGMKRQSLLSLATRYQTLKDEAYMYKHHPVYQTLSTRVFELLDACEEELMVLLMSMG